MRRVAYILNATAAEGQTTYRLDAYPGTFTQVFAGGLLLPPPAYQITNNTLLLASAPAEGASVLAISGQGGSFVTADHIDTLAATLATEESVASRFASRHKKGEDVLLPRDPVDPLGAVPLQMLQSRPAGVPKSYVDEVASRFYLKGEMDARLGLRLASDLLGQPGGVAPLTEDGKIAEFLLPRIAIGEPFVVETEAEMRALAADGTVQAGDVVRITGTTPRRVYMKNRASTGTTEGDFVELSDPTGGAAASVALDPAPPLASTNVQAFVEEYLQRHNSLKQTLRQESASGLAAEAEARTSDISAHAGREDNPHLVTHAQANPTGADPTSSNAVRDKHVSDNDTRLWEEHRTDTDNPHSVTHVQTGPLQADPSSSEATRNKHVSNKDVRDLTVHAQSVGQIGDIKQSVRATDDPNGKWLICDGRTLSRTVYADLFGIVGTSYGSGNGSTTFNLPDGRGRTMVGAASSVPGITDKSVGASGGAEAHALTESQMPAHAHSGSAGSTNPSLSHSHTTFGTRNAVYQTGGSANAVFGLTGASGDHTGLTSSNNIDGTHAHSIAIGLSGGGGSHNNMQPFFTGNWMLRVLA